MQKFVITGGKKLTGETEISGAKNVALKALVAACLTDEEIIIRNVPLISDFFIMSEIIKELGGSVILEGHTAKVRVNKYLKDRVELDRAAEIRTSAMFMAPLLARKGSAIIPNPGGCRLGARPIDRIIKGLEAMGAKINYKSEDGYFYASVEGKLRGTTYAFDKPTHTGTETLLIAASIAEGKTVLENVALEPEVDELIALLNSMGANIKRSDNKRIEIVGVEGLHGADFAIQPDRNEIVTFAIAAVITKGDIFIKHVKPDSIKEFISKLETANGGVEIKDNGVRFYHKGDLKAVDVTTSIYPGFMTDWQAPWAVLMTQATGECIVHETVFENKLGYVADMKRMGARMELFNPQVDNPKEIYSFNLEDDREEYHHAVKISGPSYLHNAVLKMENIRAGAAVVLAALVASGTSTIFEIEKLDRGYENFEGRLRSLGAEIKRITE